MNKRCLSCGSFLSKIRVPGTVNALIGVCPNRCHLRSTPPDVAPAEKPAVAPSELYRRDVMGFLRDELGVQLTPTQESALMRRVDDRRRELQVEGWTGEFWMPLTYLRVGGAVLVPVDADWSPAAQRLELVAVAPGRDVDLREHPGPLVSRRHQFTREPTPSSVLPYRR